MKNMIRLILRLAGLLAFVFVVVKVTMHFGTDANGFNSLPYLALFLIPFGFYWFASVETTYFIALYFGLICGVIFGWNLFPYFYQDVPGGTVSLVYSFSLIGTFAAAMMLLCASSLYLRRKPKRKTNTAEQGAAANP